MRVKLNSIMVDDQAAALAFYTEKVGFVKKTDIPAGEYRWITLVSPEDPDGAELVLEPNAHEAGATFQAALYADGIPATALLSDDIAADVERLKAAGVAFRTEPTDMGGVTYAVFDDTCGNFMQIYQETGAGNEAD